MPAKPPCLRYTLAFVTFSILDPFVMAMFESLSDRLSQTLRKITGKAHLTEDNIKDSLREVRMALLEADVALPVVKDFVDHVRQRAVGTEVSRSLNPGQQFLKIVQQRSEERRVGKECRSR